MIKKQLATDNQIIESSIRKFSNKLQGNIDVVSSSTYVRNNEKYFYANENENFIKLTRIKYPFEGFLLKIVFVFTKNNFQKYIIRLGIMSTILFALVTLFSLFVTILSLIRREYDVVFSYLVLPAVFVILLYVEYRLSVKRLNLILYKS